MRLHNLVEGETPDDSVLATFRFALSPHFPRRHTTRIRKRVAHERGGAQYVPPGGNRQVMLQHRSRASAKDAPTPLHDAIATRLMWRTAGESNGTLVAKTLDFRHVKFRRVISVKAADSYFERKT